MQATTAISDHREASFVGIKRAGQSIKPDFSPRIAPKVAHVDIWQGLGSAGLTAANWCLRPESPGS